jgi:hypothetical protein
MKAALLALASVGSAVAPLSAAAGDLPPRPVESLAACALTVGGFYEVPGTHTCLRISGYTRIDYGRNATSVQVPQTGGPAGGQDRTVDSYQTRHRLLLQLDSRTPTQEGTLRTVGRFYVSNQNQSEVISVSRAFIQWAGFTIGRAPSSSYIFGFSESWRHISQQQNQPPSGEGGVNQISYALDLGQGITLGLGADERQTKSIANLSNSAALRVGSDQLLLRSMAAGCPSRFEGPPGMGPHQYKCDLSQRLRDLLQRANVGRRSGGRASRRLLATGPARHDAMRPPG